MKAVVFLYPERTFSLRKWPTGFEMRLDVRQTSEKICFFAGSPF